MKQVNEIATLALAILSVLIFPAIRDHLKLKERVSALEQSDRETQRKLHEEIAGRQVLRDSYANIAQQLAVLTERIENMNKAIINRDDWMEKVLDLLSHEKIREVGR